MIDAPIRFAYRCCIGGIYLFLLAPLFFIIAVSVNGGTVPSFPPSDLSLRWYGQALLLPSFQRGAIASLWLALAATLLAAPAGTAAAIAISRGRFRRKALLETILLAPLIVPGLVIGIALLVAFVAIDIHEVPLRLLAAHVLFVLPYTIRTVLASFSRLDGALEEAAIMLGASRWAAFRLVTLPLIKTGIVAGMAFSFILSFDDIAISLFLVDAKTTTLPVAIFSYLQYNFDPSIAAVSSLLIGVTLGLAFLLERFFGLKRLLGG